MIRGPGTVGLDSSVPIDELVNTTLEALEYFGVYNISRYYTYHPASLRTNINIDGVKHHQESSHDKTSKTECSSSSLSSVVEDINDENRSTRYDTNYKSSSSSSGSRSISMKHPQLPEELILDRRVSMGVYSLFTKF